jgi:hypothetical protein
MSQTRLGSTKEVLHLPYQATNLVNVNGTMHTGQTGVLAWAAPASGWVIGFSGNLNASLTAGTITAHATVNGSLLPGFNANGASVLVPEHAYGYQRHEAGRALHRFSAGDRLGMEYRASNTIDPETTDGSFLLVVLLEDVQY